MFGSLKKLVAGLKGGEKQQAFETTDYRLAAAGLLAHVLGCDGSLKEAEHARLHSVLKSRFGLDEAATEKLIEEAIELDREAVDLYGFTSVLKRALDEEERRRVVEMMWEVAFSDGEVHEFEENIVWRAADLLGISARDRIALKKRVAASHPASE